MLDLTGMETSQPDLVASKAMMSNLVALEGLMPDLVGP